MLFLIDELFGAHNFPFLAMFAPFFMMAFIGIAIIAGLVWAPFGASACALIAWRRGLLNPYRCAVAGAAYSALFFLPWVYLAARMLGWAIPKPLIALPYVVLYVSWLQGPAQFSYDAWDWGNEAYPGALWFWAWLANMFTMVASLLLMTPVKRINPFRRARRDAPLRDTLPNPVYLLPFALLWGWTVALFALTVLSGGAEG